MKSGGCSALVDEANQGKCLALSHLTALESLRAPVRLVPQARRAGLDHRLVALPVAAWVTVGHHASASSLQTLLNDDCLGNRLTLRAI